MQRIVILICLVCMLGITGCKGVQAALGLASGESVVITDEDGNKIVDTIKVVGSVIDDAKEKKEGNDWSTWDVIGNIAVTILLGAAGYLFVGRPIRLGANKFLLNPSKEDPKV